MSKALRGGMPRVFRNHKGPRGAWFRGQYTALESRFGPFDATARQYAGGVAALWCEWKSDVRLLEAAELVRRTATGRRPSTQQIARLKKRAALSWGSYDMALRRLHELTAERPVDFGALFTKDGSQ